MWKPDEMYDLQQLEEKLRNSKPKTEPLPPAFKQQLRASLLKQQAAASRPAARRFKLAAVGAALAALLLVIVAVTPAGQIIAGSFLQFGPFTLTDAPSAAERTITATPSRIYPVRTELVSLIEAAEQVDFTVLYPRDLPDAYTGGEAPTVTLIYNSAGRVSTVETMWFGRTDEQILYYTQTPYTPDPNRSPFELGIGDAEATPVTVGQAEGVWLENFNWGVEANKTPAPYNVLIWQLTTPGGETFLFWLGSQEQLPLDEMLQIAESMAPAGSGPANGLNIPFGDEITLLGFELTDQMLTLHWQVNTPQTTKLTSFVHWRTAAGMIAAQIDRPHTARPGSSNQTIIETYELRPLNLSPGAYTIFVGLYNPDTGQRLPVPKFPNNEIRLTEIEIK